MLYRKAFINFCCLLSLVSFGCNTLKTTQVYEGEKQSRSNIAILSLIQHDVDTRVCSIDGTQLQQKGTLELLPGEKLVEVRCVKHQPRDPLGTWRGHSFLKFEPQAGHEYKLHAKTIGPGRCCSEENICTMWIVDKKSGTIVSELHSQQ